eukprot:285234_1
MMLCLKRFAGRIKTKKCINCMKQFCSSSNSNMIKTIQNMINRLNIQYDGYDKTSLIERSKEFEEYLKLEEDTPEFRDILNEICNDIQEMEDELFDSVHPNMQGSWFQIVAQSQSVRNGSKIFAEDLLNIYIQTISSYNMEPVCIYRREADDGLEEALIEISDQGAYGLLRYEHGESVMKYKNDPSVKHPKHKRGYCASGKTVDTNIKFPCFTRAWPISNETQFKLPEEHDKMQMQRWGAKNADRPYIVRDEKISFESNQGGSLEMNRLYAISIGTFKAATIGIHLDQTQFRAFDERLDQVTENRIHYKYNYSNVCTYGLQDFLEKK